MRRVFERGCGVAARGGMGGAGMSDAAGVDGACSCGMGGLGASGGGTPAQGSSSIGDSGPWLHSVLEVGRQRPWAVLPNDEARRAHCKGEDVVRWHETLREFGGEAVRVP